jgi:hypothetical protein
MEKKDAGGLVGLMSGVALTGYQMGTEIDDELSAIRALQSAAFAFASSCLSPYLRRARWKPSGPPSWAACGDVQGTGCRAVRRPAPCARSRLGSVVLRWLGWPADSQRAVAAVGDRVIGVVGEMVRGGGGIWVGADPGPNADNNWPVVKVVICLIKQGHNRKLNDVCLSIYIYYYYTNIKRHRGGRSNKS